MIFKSDRQRMKVMATLNSSQQDKSIKDSKDSDALSRADFISSPDHKVGEHVKIKDNDKIVAGKIIKADITEGKTSYVIRVTHPFYRYGTKMTYNYIY